MREARLHKEVADFLAVALRPPTFWTTFPAGGGGIVRGRQLKAMGLKSGFPDLLIIHEGKAFGIELKAPGKYLEPHQREMHAALLLAGMPVYTARSKEEITYALETWAIPHFAKVAA